MADWEYEQQNQKKVLREHASYERDLRKEGDVRTKRKIAKKLKSYGFLKNDFIAEVVELDIKTVEKLKEKRPSNLA